MVIFGYSGHAYVIIESIVKSGKEVYGYLTDSPVNHNPYGLKYCGFESSESDVIAIKERAYIVAIGDNRIREKVSTKVHNLLGKLPTSILDVTAEISESTVIGEGSYIGKLTTVNAQTKIGRGVICNTNSIIEHDCTIADFSHIGPGAILCGGVKIGQRSFVGAGAVVLPGVKIGSNVVIGAGSVVTKDTTDNIIMIGNPARII